MPAVLVNRDYCHAELAVPSLAVVIMTAGHYVYPHRDGHIELAGVHCLNTRAVVVKSSPIVL